MVFSENGADQTYISLIIPVIRMCECVTPWSMGDQYQSSLHIRLSWFFYRIVVQFVRLLLFVCQLCVFISMSKCVYRIFDQLFFYQIVWFSDQIVVQFVDLRCLCPCSPGESRSKDGERRKGIFTRENRATQNDSECLSVCLSVPVSLCEHVCFVVAVCLSLSLSLFLPLSVSAKEPLEVLYVCTSLRLVLIMRTYSNPKF